MKTYRITQLKTYAMDYRVQANTPMEALEKMQDGRPQADIVPDLDSLTFYDNDFDRGMSGEEFRELFPDDVDEMTSIPGLNLNHDYIPGIQMIEEEERPEEEKAS